MKFRLIALVAMMSVCTAVSAKKPVAPPIPVAEHLPVEVVLNQHEMGVDVPNTAEAVGMQFGLLGALVGAAIQQAQVSNAQHRVEQIRNLLVDYRFNEKVEAAVRARLNSDGISHDPQFTFMASPWDANTALQAGKTSQNGVFVIAPRYAMLSNFEMMQVILNVSLVDRTVKANGKIKEKPTYTRSYVWHIPMSKIAGSGATEDAQRWVDLGTPGLSALLDEGIDEVVQMMVYDFSAEGRLESGQSTKGLNATLGNHIYRGREVKHDANWVWVRDGVTLLGGYHPLDTAVASTATTAAPAAAAAAAPSAPAQVAPEAARAIEAPAAGASDAAAPAAAPTTAPATGAGAR